MPDKSDKVIVCNTSPLIALVAAMGSLEPLGQLYRSVLVPLEVSDEICAGGTDNFAVDAFKAAEFLVVPEQRSSILPYLSNSLDKGEAAVIQLAIDRGINTVCIDESVGRRIARMNGLALTGSIGILARYKKELNADFSLMQAVDQMRAKGIYLGEQVIHFARQQDQ
jgi:predicted nucleic acid-binding protein